MNPKRVAAAFLASATALVSGAVIGTTPAVSAAALAACTTPLAEGRDANFTVALMAANGSLMSWGLDSGELGHGTFATSAPFETLTPAPVLDVSGQGSLTGVVSVVAGSFHVLALKSTGEVFAWGNNFWGQIGNGRQGYDYANNRPLTSLLPVQVLGPLGQGFLTGVKSITAGFESSVAVKTDGTVWAWGLQYGSTPTQVLGFNGPVAQVSAGGAHYVALQADGTVWTWGINTYGELGDGTTNNSNVPVRVLAGPHALLEGVVQVAASQFDSYALDSGGAVWAWGNNVFGQLGNGTAPTDSSFPVAVSLPGGGVGIRSGDTTAFAWTTSAVYGWGEAANGQLGNGTDAFHGGPSLYASPVAVQSPMVADIAAGSLETAALYPDGTLRGWGNVSPGDGTPIVTSSSPIALGLTGVAQPQGCPQPAPSYLPSKNGYQFNNSGNSIPAPSQLATYYPSSTGQIYQASGSLSNAGKLFYDNLFVPAFTAGLCYGMVTSDTYLFNRASPPPDTFTRWTKLSDPFLGGTLAPPVTTGDQTLEQFLDRYHARQLASAAAASSINVWNYVGHNIGSTNNRTQGNLAAFDQIAAQVRTQPQVVALGPSPYILSGGPGILAIPLPDPGHFWDLFNNTSHAVVAYDTLLKADGTRVIKVYDPSSASFSGRVVIDDSRIEVATDGSIKLISYSGGADAGGNNPKVWLGSGGVDSNKHSLGQPGDWILMPLQDADFSDAGNIAGHDNSHWVIPDAAATVINVSNAPWFLLGGIPIMHFSGAGSGASAVTLPAGTAYDNTITAIGSPALAAVTSQGHMAAATQTDANAAGSSHHMLVDPAATSIQLDSATQLETFTLAIGGDFLPAFSRKITMNGLTLAPSQSVNLASDPQTSGLTVSASSATATVVSTTLEQTGANPGTATVQITVPASSTPASITVANWNDLVHSLIYETSAVNGKQVVTILQDNPVQRTATIDGLFVQLNATVIGVSDPDVRKALTAAVQVAQAFFHKGNRKITATILVGLEFAVKALPATKMPATTAASIVSLSQQIRGLL